MIFVVVEEVIPVSQEEGNKDWASMSLMIRVLKKYTHMNENTNLIIEIFSPTLMNEYLNKLIESCFAPIEFYLLRKDLHMLTFIHIHIKRFENHL
ncbi:hypothetical protein J18TS1_24590 [Oceanobacillus oncorhynchi subsp. incaldanensis]|nr:hypothetical protein J18TS1_24590 [Oceanobacillus oncorhynchi subsp. incaldanensis]